jgi:flagellar P-ring protein precursor FlgI
VVLPQVETYADEESSAVVTLEEGISVSELVQALNDLGVSARDMIAIFQAMRAAGALHAEIVLL